MSANDSSIEFDRPGRSDRVDESDPAVDLMLAVWPRRDGRDWRAELRFADASMPLRFSRPVDLVLFLTALPGGDGSAAVGLR